MERPLDGALDVKDPWPVDLAEPFVVSTIEGRAAALLAAEGSWGGPIEVCLLDVGGGIDLRLDGVPVREGVEEPDETAELSCLVGDLPGF